MIYGSVGRWPVANLVRFDHHILDQLYELFKSNLLLDLHALLSWLQLLEYIHNNKKKRCGANYGYNTGDWNCNESSILLILPLPVETCRKISNWVSNRFSCFIQVGLFRPCFARVSPVFRPRFARVSCGGFLNRSRYEPLPCGWFARNRRSSVWCGIRSLIAVSSASNSFATNSWKRPVRFDRSGLATCQRKLLEKW